MNQKIGELRTADENLVSGMKQPTIDFSKSTKDGFSSQLDELTKQFGKNHDKPVDHFTIGSEWAVPIRAQDFEDPFERAMRDAREFIDKSKYNQAAAALDRALQIKSGNAEALYLSGYCYFMLEQPEQALVTLLPLKNMKLAAALAKEVTTLKEKIRGQMLFKVVILNIILIRGNKFEQAIQHMNQVIQIDPDCEIYHFLLGGSLMNAGQLDRARAAIQVGIQSCGAANSEMLQNLKGQVMDRQVAAQLAPARDFVKRGQHDKARDKIRALPADLRQTILVKNFETYLGEMGNNGNLSYGSKARVLTPTVKYKTMDDFHFFLVGSEIKSASDLMQKGKFQDAEKILENVVALAPRFPFGHYLYANCVLDRLMQRTQARGGKPSAEDVESMIKTANEHARFGSVDTEIKGAQTLVDVTGNFLTTIKDSKSFNELAAKFQAIMNGVKKGIKTPQQLKDVHAQISQLRDEVSRGAKSASTSDSKKNFDDLYAAVDRNFQQLQTMKLELEETEAVNNLSAQFMARMEAIKRRGGLNTWERSSERTYFEDLKGDAQNTMNKSYSSKARQELKTLIDVIDKVISQLS